MLTTIHSHSHTHTHTCGQSRLPNSHHMHVCGLWEKGRRTRADTVKSTERPGIERTTFLLWGGSSNPAFCMHFIQYFIVVFQWAAPKKNQKLLNITVYCPHSEPWRVATSHSANFQPSVKMCDTAATLLEITPATDKASAWCSESSLILSVFL